MNVSLSFNNMFKLRGPVNIKWNSPFEYPNHAWPIGNDDVVFLGMVFTHSL
jgi:hypothetical protein